MPIRFPTEAANDPDVGGDRTPRGRATPAPRERGEGVSPGDEAKPGQDINQPGFIRERDRDRDPDRER